MAAEEREKMLRSALDDQKHEANQLNESAIEYNLLKRDLDTSRQLYEGLLQRLKEAGVTAGLKSNNIRIIDAARAPMAPSSPNIPRNLVLALMVGVVCGLMLAFVQEATDNTLRTPEQVQATSSLASLGFIFVNASITPSSIARRHLSVTDAVMLSAKVDSVLIVIFAGKTRKEALRRVRELFLQVNARLMGVVVNGVDLRSPDHYYYYYGKRYGEAAYYGGAYRRRAQAEEAEK